jgi:hypothetical protein
VNRQTWKGNTGSARHAGIPDPGSPGLDNTCIRANAQRLGACAFTSNHWAGQSWGCSGRAASSWMARGGVLIVFQPLAFGKADWTVRALPFLHGGLKFNIDLPRQPSRAPWSSKRCHSRTTQEPCCAGGTRAPLQPTCQTRESGFVAFITCTTNTQEKAGIKSQFPAQRISEPGNAGLDEGVVVAKRNEPSLSFWVWLYLARQLLVGCGTAPLSLAQSARTTSQAHTHNGKP